MNKKEIKFLNDIKNGNTKLLWYANKYDGIPICGLMKYDSSFCWYRQYDIDVKFGHYTDAQLLKSGYRQDQIDLMTNDDKEYEDEIFYYKVYKLSYYDLKRIEKRHEQFRKYVGTHCDYEGESVIRASHMHDKYYKGTTDDREDSLDSLLDNIFIKVFKKIRRIFVSTKINISNAEKDKVEFFEKDVVGYFKI